MLLRWLLGLLLKCCQVQRSKDELNQASIWMGTNHPWNIMPLSTDFPLQPLVCQYKTFCHGIAPVLAYTSANWSFNLIKTLQILRSLQVDTIEFSFPRFHMPFLLNLPIPNFNSLKLHMHAIPLDADQETDLELIL